MNHTKNLAIVLAMLAIATALIGAVGISIQHTAAAYGVVRDPNSNKNTIDLENSETNFIFKQKLKNNCSGFAACTNTATETLTPPAVGAGGGPGGT
jgi:hypothetical protein